MTYGEDGWTNWIEHDGKGCPREGIVVWIEVGSFQEHDPTLCGDWPSPWLAVSATEAIGRAEDGPGWRGGGFDEYGDGWFPIIRYRIRKPRGLTILEEVAAGIREPVDA